MRYVRSFLLALTTLAFFLLVLVAGLYVFITPERVSARLANTLSHHLGLKIEMAKLHIDTSLPSLKFTVKDAVLTSADGAVRGSVPSATMLLYRRSAVCWDRFRFDMVSLLLFSVPEAQLPLDIFPSILYYIVRQCKRNQTT